MKAAISNSGPLIHLASTGLLDFLFYLYNVILIPESVYEETVIRGKEQEFPDALLIEKAIKDKKIEVKRVKKNSDKYFYSKLHQGEFDAIRLALDSKIEIILLDDEEARIFARTMNLKVKGTLGILIDLYKEGYINLERSLQYLKKLNSLMYLSADVYNLVEERLKRVKK